MADDAQPLATSTPDIPEIPEAAPVQHQKKSLYEIVQSGSESDLKDRIQLEIEKLIKEKPKILTTYCLLALYAPTSNIGTWESDRIYSALKKKRIPTNQKTCS